MADNKRRIHRYHIDFTSVLLFLLAFCAVDVVFTFVKGCDVMFYAGFPMLTAALLGAVSFISVDAYVEEQTLLRLKRGRIRDAVHVLWSALEVSALWGVLLGILFGVFADEVCGALFEVERIASVYRAFTPAIALMGPVGCLTGFLRGIGQKRLARMGLWMISALFTGLSLACGFYWSYRGVKVGVLLQNEDMSAIYCGCGIAMGLDLAVIVTLTILAFMSRICAGRLRPFRGRKGVVYEETDRLEGDGGLRSYCAQRLLPAVFLAFVPFLGIVVGYRLWVGGQSTTAILTSVWGGFTGAGLFVLIGFAIIAAMPMTVMTARLIRDRTDGKEKAMNTRLSMLLRLSAYVSIPWSVFCFGAANEIIAMFPDLTVRGRLAAVMTVKYGCVLVFLIQLLLLMGYYYWNCRQQRILILAASIAFFAQIISLVIMSNLGLGIVMLVLSIDIYCAVNLLTMYILGRSDLIRGLSGAWIIDDALITVCALIAVIPIEFLNDYLIELLPGAAAFLAAAAVFAVLYVLASILLKAADLRNVEKLPGGGLVVSLAYILGAVQMEDEE